MQSNQFKRRQQPEAFEPKQPYIKQRRINWGMVIYGTVVLLILFFVGRFLVGKFLFVEAPGQILFKQFEVQLPADAQLVSIYKAEGDFINKGDTLFRYTWRDALNLSADASSGYGFLNKQNLSQSWIQQELLDIQNDLQEKRARIRSYRTRIQHYQKRKAKVRQGVQLDVYTIDELYAVEDRLIRLRTQKSELYASIRELKKYKNELHRKRSRFRKRQQQLSNRNFGLKADSLAKYSNYYTSPISGKIKRQKKQAFEVAKASEPIMQILKKEEIIVRAYFKQSSLGYIEEGDEVSITFPNGRKFPGEISTIYTATQLVPKAFRDQKNAPSRKLAADIKLKAIPNNNRKRLQEYYKMTVTVRKQMLKIRDLW